MVILLRYTSAFSEVIYVDFYAKILDWNFRLIDENGQILVVVFVCKLNFSFSFRFVDENCRIFVVVVIFVTKINLFSSTKIFVFVIVHEKNTGMVVHRLYRFLFVFCVWVCGSHCWHKIDKLWQQISCRGVFRRARSLAACYRGLATQIGKL